MWMVESFVWIREASSLFAPSRVHSVATAQLHSPSRFSKTICPGSRCGWITAAPLLIEKFVMHADGNAGAASGFVQSMLVAMLIKWDMDGWAKCEHLFYTSICVASDILAA